MFKEETKRCKQPFSNLREMAVCKIWISSAIHESRKRWQNIGRFPLQRKVKVDEWGESCGKQALCCNMSHACSCATGKLLEFRNEPESEVKYPALYGRIDKFIDNSIWLSLTWSAQLRFTLMQRSWSDPTRAKLERARIDVLRQHCAVKATNEHSNELKFWLPERSNRKA